MKNVEIKHFTHAEVDAPKEMFGFLKIPMEHKLIRAEGQDLEVSDGYHTFDELYEHRIALYIALCRGLASIQAISDMAGGFMTKDYYIWRSKLHADGSSFEGWFILGIDKEAGEQITYHLPLSRWDETDFAETLDNAPEWDGHTPQDVINRLKKL
jgi:hypothetical protein